MPEFIPQGSSQLTDIEYQNYILQGVSRTFALTIPELPDALRDIVGNGYLLCRIADTIEDDATISIEDKISLATQFIFLCEHTDSNSEKFVEELSAKLAKQTPLAEINLIENTQRVLQITRSFTKEQQTILARCVRTMLEGMIHFQGKASTAGLDDMKSMNSYCYHVAGVVGEMLTELYSDYSTDIAAQHETLLPLSVSFGQGLQMTNILKDIWTDHERGMCWLPNDFFLEHGIKLEDLPAHAKSENFKAAMHELVSIAAGHLKNAMDYTLRIPKDEKGLRLFSLWAIGMAQLSLRKLNQNLDYTNGSQVKISRRSVKATIVLTRLANSNNFLLRQLFNFIQKSLPYKQVSINLKDLPVTYKL